MGRGRLDGKTALITGAARGMGAAMARLFADEGARVLALDIDGAGVRAVAEGIGDAALAMALDVSREPGWTEAAELALARFGGIDVLVNNASSPTRRSTTSTSRNGTASRRSTCAARSWGPRRCCRR